MTIAASPAAMADAEDTASTGRRAGLPRGVARAIAHLPHGAFAGRLDDGQLFLQHGPTNLVIRIEADRAAVERAERELLAQFPHWLGSVVPELDRLRRREAPDLPLPSSPIAKAMVDAVRPLAHVFVTPMAAVAGAIADAAARVIADVPGIRRAWVNNGGDIALVIGAGERIDIGLMTSDFATAPSGWLGVGNDSPARGVATSGWRGRSHSLGVADAVTVLADSAARADAAATVIASATDVASPAVRRVAAAELDDAPDLGDLGVTVDVGRLDVTECQAALASGLAVAQSALERGAIRAAALCVQGHWASVGEPVSGLPTPSFTPETRS